MRIASPSVPGTPIASNTTGGRRPSSRCHTSIGGSTAGSTTCVAPIASATSRRRGEKSLTTIDSMSMRRSSAIDREPDRARAEHDGSFVGGDVGTRDRVTADRHRFRQRRAPVIEAVRHLEAHARGQPHQLRVAAVVDVRVRADGFDPGRCDRDRERRDEVTGRDRDAIGSVTELEHLGGELVSHHVVALRVERDRRADFAAVSTSWSA